MREMHRRPHYDDAPATSCAAVKAEQCDAPAGCTACGGDCPKRPPYRTIVIDPAWPYEDRVNKKNRGAANHYDLMSVEDLTDLAPLLRGIADKEGSHLYLWTTNSFLGVAFTLMARWGWTQKTVRTWVKPQMGMGRYYRNDTEHVVFGVRGKLPGMAKDIRTSFVAPRGKHSAKPDLFYAQVERMSPGPYLDVFARRARAGWRTIGNEMDGTSVDVALRRLHAQATHAPQQR